MPEYVYLLGWQGSYPQELWMSIIKNLNARAFGVQERNPHEGVGISGAWHEWKEVTDQNSSHKRPGEGRNSDFRG
jgi:hypothetical protein